MAQQESEDGSRGIRLLGMTSLLNDLSSEIIQPILPLFIVSLGGGGMAIGLAGGLADGIPGLMRVFFGYLADRTGQKKPFVIIGYGLSALAKLLYPLSITWGQVVALKSFERLGKGIRAAPKDAMVADFASPDLRGQGFGILRSMDSFGAVLGSALAFLMWRLSFEFRTIFLIAAIASVLSFVPLLMIKESCRRPAKGFMLCISALPRDLRYFIVIASLFSASNISYMFFILQASSQFSGSSSIGAPLLLYVLFNLVYAALALPAGILSDRIGRKAVLIAGYALFSIVAAFFALGPSGYSLVLLFALYGTVYALVDGVQSAAVSDLSPKSTRGTSLGVYYAATALSSIFSGIVAGWLWQAFSPGHAFMMASAGAAASAIGLVGLARMK